MATAVSDMSSAATQTVVPLTGGSVQGSTQEYRFTPSSQRSPVAVFFAPLGYLEQLNMFWGSLLRATVPIFCVSITSTTSSSIEWDRLSLELMCIANLHSNWDGEGAEAVPPMAVNNAETLIQL